MTDFIREDFYLLVTIVAMMIRRMRVATSRPMKNLLCLGWLHRLEGGLQVIVTLK